MQGQDSLDEIASRFHAEIALGVAYPQDFFNRKYSEANFKVAGALSYRPIKDKYLYAQLFTQWYQLDRLSTTYLIRVDNYTYNVTHTATSALLDLGAAIKYEAPQIFYLIPFVRFGLGARNAYLYSSIEDSDNETLDSYRSESDWSYMYLFDLGLQVPLTPRFHLALSGTYTGSGSLDIPLESDRDVPVNSTYPEDYFSIIKSPAELLDIQLGLYIYFK